MCDRFAVSGPKGATVTIVTNANRKLTITQRMLAAIKSGDVKHVPMKR